MSTTSTSTQQHREMATEEGPVAVAIVTVSDTRTPETDKNAAFLREQLAADGNSVAAYQIIKDEPDQVASVLDKMAESEASHPLQRRHRHRPTRHHIRYSRSEVGKDAPRIRRTLSDVQLRSGRCSSNVVTSDRWCLSRKSGHLHTRFNRRRAISMGKANWTGIATSGMGSRTLTPSQICHIAAGEVSQPRLFFPYLLTADSRQPILQDFTRKRINLPQPRRVIDTVCIAEIEQLQSNDTNQTDRQNSEQTEIPRAHLQSPQRTPLRCLLRRKPPTLNGFTEVRRMPDVTCQDRSETIENAPTGCQQIQSKITESSEPLGTEDSRCLISNHRNEMQGGRYHKSEGRWHA